jgi:hypothetical protein
MESWYRVDIVNMSCSHLASHLNVKSGIGIYMIKCTLWPPTD